MQKKTAVSAALLCAALACGVNAQQPPAPVSPSGEAIADRLATDMIFAGKLADSMMDRGILPDSLPYDPSSDPTALRASLILWIRANPQKAADYYNGAAESNVHSNWSIRSHFKELVADLKKAAGSASDEKAVFQGRLIFEGNQAFNREDLPQRGQGGVLSSGGNRGGGKAVELPAFDWKLDSSAVARERAASAKWLGSLERELENDKAQEASRLTGNRYSAAVLQNDETARDKTLSSVVQGHTVAQILQDVFAPREQLIGRAQKAAAYFSSAASSFAGRKDLSAQEASALEGARRQFRAEFAAASLAGRMHDVQRARDAIADAGIKNGFLETQGAIIAGDFDAVRKMLADGTAPEQAFAAMRAAQEKLDAWKAVCYAVSLLPQYGREPLRLWRLPAAGKVIEPRLSPAGNYKKALHQLALQKEAADELSASGDALSAAEFLAGFSKTGSVYDGAAVFSSEMERARQTVNISRLSMEFVQAEITGPFYALAEIAGPLAKNLAKSLGKK